MRITLGLHYVPGLLESAWAMISVIRSVQAKHGQQDTAGDQGRYIYIYIYILTLVGIEIPALCWVASQYTIPSIVALAGCADVTRKRSSWLCLRLSTHI